MSDGVDWTSAGRLFQSREPAAAKERSPTVTRRDGRTTRRLEVDKRSRGGFDVSSTDQRRTAAGLTSTEVQCREELGRQ